MTLGISQFRDIARTAAPDRNIVLGNWGSAVKDRGAFSSTFTLKSTFRAATQEFLKSYRAAYGNHLGEIAQDMLRDDVAAGRPLSASTVKALIDMADGKVENFRNAPIGSFYSKTFMAEVSTNVCKAFCPRYTMAQKTAVTQLIAATCPHLPEAVVAEMETGGFAALTATIVERRLPLLKLGLEMIFEHPDSPFSSDGDIIAKLKTLELLSRNCVPIFRAVNGAPDPFACAERNNATVKTLLSVASLIPKGEDGLREVTQATLYEALFPEEVFDRAKCDSLNMPYRSRAEVDLMSPEAFFQAVKDDLAYFREGAPQALPKESPFRGQDRVALAMHSHLPKDILTAQGTRSLSLADLPRIREEAQRLHSAFSTAEEAIRHFERDASRLGQGNLLDDPEAPIPSPKWRINVQGNLLLEPEDNLDAELDAEMVMEDEYTEEQAIIETVSSLARSEEQMRVVMTCLSAPGLLPLRSLVLSMGAKGTLSDDPITHDYYILQHLDGSISVTITIDEGSADHSGVGYIGYTVRPDGQVALDKLEWSPPNKEQLHDPVAHFDPVWDSDDGIWL